MKPPEGLTFYGGPGALGPAPSVGSPGAPYQQAPALQANNGEGACPYKVGTGLWPAGCPGNLSRIAWYVTALNARLRQINSSQQVSMLNWDSEFNGPVGLQCSLFQLAYGIRQFGTADDVLPVVNGKTAMPWKVFVHGSSGLTSDAATADPAKTACGYWDKTDINIVGTPVSSVNNFGEMIDFQAAPEYYWLAGIDNSDLGNVANSPGSTGTRNGLMPTLADAGYIGCPQSAPGKNLYDANCGCRSTVYEEYGRQPNGGTELYNVLSYAYDAMGVTPLQVANSAPTFSIEHLGDPRFQDAHSSCVNSTNFCSYSAEACTDDPKCQVRCGVMNAFGTWTESCFGQFLDAFAAGVKENINSSKPPRVTLMVYDAGFIPQRWLDDYSLTAAATCACGKGKTCFPPTLPATPLQCVPSPGLAPPNVPIPPPPPSPTMKASATPIEIYLPSYTAFTGTGLATFATNILNFIKGFNTRFSAYNVQIVGFMPLRSSESSSTSSGPLDNDQWNSDFVRISQAAYQIGLADLQLGITQYGDEINQVASVADINAACTASSKASGTSLPQYTIYNVDSQNPGLNSIPLPTLMSKMAAVAKSTRNTGITTFSVATNPKATSVNSKLTPITGYKQVVIPEIYDISYGGNTTTPFALPCEFLVPPRCSPQPAGCSTCLSGCTSSAPVSADSISASVQNLFTTCGVPLGTNIPALTVLNTPDLQTWPAFSIQPNPGCYAGKANPTITGTWGVGCTNMDNYTVDQFVQFAIDYAAQHIASTKGAASTTITTITLYEAAFIPQSWLAGVGAPFYPCTSGVCS